MKLRHYGKKGVFFSIISLFIVLIFVILAKINSESNIERNKIETTSIRVEILNNIVKDINNRYLDRVFYIATKNAFQGLSKYYRSKNFNYVDLKSGDILDVNSEIPIYDVRNITSDLILNGTLNLVTKMNPNGVVKEEDIIKLNLKSIYLLENYTLIGQLERLKDVYSHIGIDIEEFRVKNIETKQDDPFHLTISADIEYYFVDENKIASWRGDVKKEVKVSIYGMLAYDFEEWNFLDISKGEIANIGLITDAWSIDEIDSDAVDDGSLTSWCGNARSEDPESLYFFKECYSEMNYLDKLSGFTKPSEINDYYWQKTYSYGICFSDYCSYNQGCDYNVPDELDDKVLGKFKYNGACR